MARNRGGIVSYSIGTDSEVGCLRTVLVHRPGLELRRITPKTRGRLGFDGQPWVARAQQEHDVLTDVLRDRGAEVLYVTELLQDVLGYASARDEAIASVLAEAELGDVLGASVRDHLASLPPEELAGVLVAGLTPGELQRRAAASSTTCSIRTTSSSTRCRTSCSPGTRAPGSATRP